MSTPRVKPPAGDDDATVLLAPKAAPRRTGRLAVAAGLVAAVVLGGAAWLALGPSPAPRPTPAVVAIPPVAPPPHMAVADGDEASILASRASDLQVFRFGAEPRVLVLSFPTLHAQGQMLNRLGAFVEKAGVPRNRVLTDPELTAAILRSGETPDTYNYGHDYSAAELARFFAAAARDGVALRPEEQTLGALLVQEGMLAPGAVGAVISIPPETADPPVGAAARATILRHELSHGAYFTDPAYTAYAQRFWQTALTDAQRAGFRRFLASEGYDGADEDLMMNETQAYLVHTRNRQFFDPRMAGLTEVEAERLRDAFLHDMPDGWLARLPQSGPAHVAQ